MAKGKGKSSSSSGPHKKHGPKKHMFKEYKPMVHAFAKAGVLDKYHNIESFILSCQARGLKSGGQAEWEARFKLFTQDLKTHKEQIEWLRNCKNYKDPEAKKEIKKAQ